LSNKWRGIISYASIGLAVILATVLFSNMKTPETTTLKYYEILNYFDSGNVESYTLDLGTGEMTLKPTDSDEDITYTVPNVSVFLDDIRSIEERHPEWSATQMQQDYLPVDETPWWFSILPTVLLVGAMAVFWIYMMRQAGGGKVMNFAKAKYKVTDESRRTTFADVAGCDEEKEELQEIVEFLKNPEQFNTLGARIPKGVLLVGQPGTGKTLMARAVAERQACLSSRFPARILSRFSWAWAPRVSATCSTRPRRTPRPSSLSMRSTPLADTEAQASAAATTSVSRRSTSCSSRWTASAPTPASS
jgi:cell division protease FtsH